MDQPIKHSPDIKKNDIIPGFVFQFAEDDHGNRRFPMFSVSIMRIFGWTEKDLQVHVEEVLGRVHHDDRHDLEGAIRESKEAQSIWGHTFRFVCGKGKVKWLQGLASPERSGDTTLWRGVIYDVTDKVECEKRIQQQQVDLEEIAFLQAHEFRRPVANMLGVFDLIDLQLRQEEQSLEKVLALIDILKISVKEADAVIAKIVTKAAELRH
ncbi:hypothetical protein BFP72_05785 [Reichenbachiella sp. 5M10]|uniref:PAS domain-containing protein n=1 Tax=Reichenbachiella sp. 5M10 TaxID=1889772 RepID=UPI000C15C747|nr:PAS domain-containing protein [Reichenbachiella sp. 5M10]PIB34938.1 hypothetical protein BFP72_05785 [Reichenbachiella sp. 5M10]